MTRSSGVLLSISSLPSNYGIGTLGKEAMYFIDFLRDSKQTYWQILPINPTSMGDSPYQSFSSYAGNPYFIDLEELINEELLTWDEVNSIDWKCAEDYINYGEMYLQRYPLLRKAFERFDTTNKDFLAFEKENKWLKDYSLFMAIKNKFNNISFLDWDKEYINKDKKTIEVFEKENKQEILFWQFLQFEFYKQFKKVKDYANKAGIKIIGDCPMFVSLDSCDVWSNPKAFQLDKDLKPTKVAGCPPDGFSPNGQRWGNPLYDWKNLKKNGYDYWLDKFEHLSKIYDVIRIDHFIGFESYYAIDAERKDGLVGKREKGPGMDLFKAIKKKLGDIEIIAEDLGSVTPEVIKLLEETGFDGMSVLMFAFGGDKANPYLPHLSKANKVAYIGTHDNEPTMEFLRTRNDWERNKILKYIGCNNEREFNWDMIRQLLALPCNRVIIQAQDLLGLEGWSRMNTPGSSGENWKWRLKRFQINDDILYRLKELTEVFDRERIDHIKEKDDEEKLKEEAVESLN